MRLEVLKTFMGDKDPNNTRHLNANSLHGLHDAHWMQNTRYQSCSPAHHHNGPPISQTHFCSRNHCVLYSRLKGLVESIWSRDGYDCWSSKDGSTSSRFSPSPWIDLAVPSSLYLLAYNAFLIPLCISVKYPQSMAEGSPSRASFPTHSRNHRPWYVSTFSTTITFIAYSITQSP